MITIEKVKLKKLLKQLKSYKGRHTEFVSMYIPANADLTTIIQKLKIEKATATNIKDAKTSNSVITALERVIKRLEIEVGKVHEKGIVIFSGNISDKTNITQFEVFYIEPNEPVNLKMYKCEKYFITEHLESLVSLNETQYGLIVLDVNRCSIGLLSGSKVKLIKQLNSTVPGKQKAGGQSAQRFSRIRDGEIIAFFKRCAQVVTSNFTFNKQLKGIIIGGPGTVKQNFVDGKYMNEHLKNKVIALKNLSNVDERGLQELVDDSKNVLKNEVILDEKLIINKFLKLLASNFTKTCYGEKDIIEKLNLGVVDTLIIVDNIISYDQLEKLESLCSKFSTNLQIVSSNTPESIQLKSLGGMGGILRY